jgi:signal transduction histidine kinase
MARRTIDLALVLLLAVLIEWNVWGDHPLLGTGIDGTRWVTAALPLAVALPLLWRRRVPVVVAVAVLLGADVQSIVSSNSAEGLFYVIPFSVGGFAAAAYSSRRAALLGLALLVPAYVVYAVEDRGVRRGDSGSEWAAAFFGLALLVAWLVGMFVHGRREEAALTAQAAWLEHEAQLAVAEERARIARELHDVIAHGVSVMGLQAGAAERVLGTDPERAREPLQAIQSGAREAVFELRRLLGILREGDEPAALAPVPRLAQLASLVESVRTAGLDVEISVEGEVQRTPPGVELSAYRIAQEALTNVLKHAHASSARVVLRYRARELEVEVTDDGSGARLNGAGHGLIGMRERVALYGGALTTGLTDAGGFRVLARLPYEGSS